MSKSLDDRFEEIETLADKMGLDPFPVIYEVVPREIIWDVSSYGLPTRMSHWSFGRSFVHQKTYGEMGFSKIYELILNNDPSYAFLDETNPDVVNLLVCAHVTGHSDFFKNNAMFRKTNRNMVNQAERNAHAIEALKEKYGIEVVEDWMDVAFSIDHHIDWNKGEVRDRYPSQEHVFKKIEPLPYADLFGEDLKPRVKHEIKNRTFPPHHERDLLWFLGTYANLLPWQREVFAMIRSESYYFYPQFMTKIMNEGWACVSPSTLVFTSDGIRTMKEVVEGQVPNVHDGECLRRVYDRNIIKDQPTITIRTKRGYSLTGSITHRVLLDDGVTYKRLDELSVGDDVLISSGNDSWPEREESLSWRSRSLLRLSDIAKKVGTSVGTVMRRKQGKNTSHNDEIDALLAAYEKSSAIGLPRRHGVRIPKTVDENLGAFLGYMVGDGHISRAKRCFGLTTKDYVMARDFSRLALSIFGLKAKVKKDGKRLRATLYSEGASDFLTECIGLTTGVSARIKTVPDVIFNSPEKVVRAFMRAYFDADGHAGNQGVILSTSSESMADKVQVLLLNWGILSNRNKQAHDIYNVHICGLSARKFSERIGFGLARKQKRLDKYISTREWFKTEKWSSRIKSIEYGTGDVYDISVQGTHRYAAAGFVNHNSFWHAELMLNYEGLTSSEHMDFAKAHAGVVSAGRPGSLNPYYVGFRIFGDIRKRWDEYYEEGLKDKAFQAGDDVDKYDEDGNVVMSKMTGFQKMMQVRADDDDVSFVHNYLTKDLAQDMKLYRYGTRGTTEDPEEDDIILKSRDLEKIIESMTSRLHNYGVPPIYIAEVKDKDRSLVLVHGQDKTPLDQAYAKGTLAYIAKTWGHKVTLYTRDRFGKPLVYIVDDKSSIRQIQSDDNQTVVEVEI